MVSRRSRTVRSSTNPCNLKGFCRRHLHGLLLRPVEVHRTGALSHSQQLSMDDLYHQGPHMDAGCGKGNCSPRRGLCAIPPRFVLTHFHSSPSHILGGKRGLPLHAPPDLNLVSPGDPPHQPPLPHRPAPCHRKAKSAGIAASGVFGMSRGQASPPAKIHPPWKITLPTLPLLPTQPLFLR